MGGVWERVIRSSRKVLSVVLKERNPRDESLATVMCEVETILNSRPSTKIFDDPSALKPNRLLPLLAGQERSHRSLFKRKLIQQ